MTRVVVFLCLVLGIDSRWRQRIPRYDGPGHPLHTKRGILPMCHQMGSDPAS